VEHTVEITKTEEVTITETIEIEVEKIVPYIVEIPVEVTFDS
jgi:hypothetical protein